MGIRKKKHTLMGNQKTCTKLFYLPGDDVDITECPDKLTKKFNKKPVYAPVHITKFVCVDRT